MLLIEKKVGKNDHQVGKISCPPPPNILLVMILHIITIVYSVCIDDAKTFPKNLLQFSRSCVFPKLHIDVARREKMISFLFFF